MSFLERFGIRKRAAIPTRIITATDGRDVLYNSPDGWEVSQPWIWWMGPGDGSQGPYGNPIPGADPGSFYANIPAVARCTSIICDTLAGLPWRVLRGYETLPTPDWIGDPQALRLDGRVVDRVPLVDVRRSAVEFWTQWIVDALWYGNGYVWVPVRDNRGAPKPPLWLIPPLEVEVREGKYFVGNAEVPSTDLIHLRGEPPYYGGKGTGVFERHGLDLSLASTVRQYASNVYTTGVPAGYLKVTSPNVTQEQADDLKSKWMTAHGTARRGIAVLNATTDFQPITVSPVDAQLESSKIWSARDIALAFGVPPYMLGVPGDSSTYANVESRMIELRTFTLLPWIRRIESTLDAQFSRGVSVKIVSDAVLRADTKTRFEGYQIALQNGWLTVDEVRELEDLPPIATPETPVAEEGADNAA